jgi:oxygen-independent coproporphyrinogen-3 oxidase
MSADGASEVHTAGRRGLPKSAQSSWGVSCTQRTPAGLPSGIPGIGVDIDGAVQHAAQRERQCIGFDCHGRAAVVGIFIRAALI